MDALSHLVHVLRCKLAGRSLGVTIFTVISTRGMILSCQARIQLFYLLAAGIICNVKDSIYLSPISTWHA